MPTWRGWPSALASATPGATGRRSGPGARHLVLLGLPGAGKSTVGPLVARALGCRFVDLDAEIERREGRTVARIFAEAGEGAFRAAERALTSELLGADAEPLVLAPGGGWIEDAAHRALLGRGLVAVYLRVSPELALQRMGDAMWARPLLAGPDPVATLRELLRRREPFYLQAQHVVSVDSMTPAELASSIVALASIERQD